MSPGGSTPNSRRSRPELPPSSVTVTIAVTVSADIQASPVQCAEALEDGWEASASADRYDARGAFASCAAVHWKCRKQRKRRSVRDVERGDRIHR